MPLCLVVLVDDNPDCQVSPLRRRELRANTVDDGLWIARGRQPDVIILHGVYGARGVELIERFREVAPAACVMVVVERYRLDDAEDFIELAGARFYGHVHQREELARAVEAVARLVTRRRAQAH